MGPRGLGEAVVTLIITRQRYAITMLPGVAGGVARAVLRMVLENFVKDIVPTTHWVRAGRVIGASSGMLVRLNHRS